MSILLLGRSGQLASELARCLPPLSLSGEVTAVDYPEIDLAKPDRVREIVRQNKPQIIINATAYTAVDKAESERDLAYTVNATAPGVLAEEAKALGAILIHYSTDYVFDGTKGEPYIEMDVPHPLNVYGSSKLAGEQAVQQVGGDYLILRTAWVYATPPGGNSFVTKVLQWSRRYATLRIVDDQISNPTWARALAEITGQILSAGEDSVRERSGLYHLAGDGYASRFEWAGQILKLDPQPQEQTAKDILPASTSEFPAPAKRPLFSALYCDRFSETFGLRLPDWMKALESAMRPA